MRRVWQELLRQAYHTMSHVETQVLPVAHTWHASKPTDFGLVFTDATAASSQEPYESLAVSFTSDVTRSSLEKAASHLQSGQLVAFPTETVYGLGACALRTDAAERIYRAKNRPADNPLIVHVSDRRMLSTLLPSKYPFNAACEALMKAFWPGPLTLLFPVGLDDQGLPRIPSTVTCGQSTVGLRMPSHPIARALISLAGVPVAAPSANASGRPSPTTAGHVFTDLGPRHVLSYIVDGGECSIGLESTVVDATSTPGEVRVLRPGGISVEQIAHALEQAGLSSLSLRVYGRDLARSAQQEAAPTTPGMKYRHYSPEARVLLVRIDDGEHPTVHELLRNVAASRVQAEQEARIGLLCAHDSPLILSLPDSALTRWAADATHASSSSLTDKAESRLSPVVRVNGMKLCLYSLGRRDTPSSAAQRLFDGLRTLDACVPWCDGKPGACDAIITDVVDESGVGLAIMNRLRKAASATLFARADDVRPIRIPM